MRSTFITWYPYCRRSDTIAAALGGRSHLIHYFAFKRPLHAPFKYPLQALATMRQLRHDRPDVTLVAVPPIFAALPVWLYARGTGGAFVVDAHTGIFDHARWRWLLPLTRAVMRTADAVIVTGEHLKNVVESWGARAAIIGDVPVEFGPGVAPPPCQGPRIVVVNTFSADEPIEAILEAARLVTHASFFVTGDTRYARSEWLRSKPDNLTFTRFLSEPAYAGLLRDADAIVVLTTQDHTMQRGAYEAVSLAKPLVTSTWPLLRETFARGTVYVSNEPAAIAAGVEEALGHGERLRSEMEILRDERRQLFRSRLATLIEMLEQRTAPPASAPRKRAPGEMLADAKETLKQAGKDLFTSCPDGLQSAVLSSYRGFQSLRKYDRTFRANLALLEKTQWLTPEQLRELQAERLRQLVSHAYETVPYYRALFDRHGVRPAQIGSPEDLQRIPPLSKAEITEHFDDLISRRSARIAGHLIGTSGTTGSPLHFYWDHRRETMETALLLRHLSWAGFRRGEPKAILRGLEIGARANGRATYWRFNRAENELLFSSSHLSEETIPVYLNRLREFAPAVLWGYPSSVYALAAHLEGAGAVAGLRLKGVFLSSEPVYAWQRSTIEKVFETQVFDWYGLSEGVISAGECDRHEGYHVNVESGVMEVIRSPERPHVTEIVATGLDNFMMPLIRYRTGDVGAWLDKRCSCGRGLPLMSAVETKMDDTIVTPDGRWISPSVLSFPFKSLHGIAKSQILQTRPDAITVRLVPRNGYSKGDEERLVRGMKTRLGENVTVSVEYVSDIPRTSVGKYRWVVSKVAPHRPLEEDTEGQTS